MQAASENLQSLILGALVALETWLYNAQQQPCELQRSVQHKGQEFIVGAASYLTVSLLMNLRAFKYLLLNLLSC